MMSLPVLTEDAGANLLVSARRLLALAPALALSKARIPRHS